MDIKSILDDGFIISPYYPDTAVNEYKEYKKVELSEDDIRIMITGTNGERKDLLCDDEKLVLVKYLSKYNVKPLDLIEKFTTELNEEDGPDYDELKSWSHFPEVEGNNGFLFTPHLNDKYYKQSKDGLCDYLFDKDDHIVAFIVRLIKEELREDHIEEDLKSYINFIDEVVAQRTIDKDKRTYSRDTFSLILSSLCYESYLGKEFNDEISSFYINNLMQNAEQEDNRSMRTLGYEYYEGGNGFPNDPLKACYWLEKYYKSTEDPDVARTLGYIYYYGRTTDGVPQGDKAFQYFAIGHIAGKYYEATYKLADCYVKGYGTPINHQCAFNLVDEIYSPTCKHFLNGEDSKFADVALRLGSYYKNGIYVKKDLYLAHLHYLEARLAIKVRLEHMEYIGDRGVASGIFKSINEIQNEINLEKRVIKNNGYLLDDPLLIYDDNKIKIDQLNEYIRVTIKPHKKDNEKYLISVYTPIGFMERSEKIEYLIKPQYEYLDSVEDFIESINNHKIKEFIIANNNMHIYLDNDCPACIAVNEVILVPQTLKDISRQYQLVSVEFYPNGKLYDYLCYKNDIEIGDQIEMKSPEGNKLVTIKDIKLLYEDELPLPYEKMGKIE